MNTTSDYKMKWFVDKYNNKQLDYIIRDTKSNYGTIIMPTGTGKSGVVYADIINHIDNLNGKKLIINISCPILKLSQQFINDLFEVLSHIYNKNIQNKFSFFINSSDSGKKYKLHDIKINTYYFSVKTEKNDISDFERYFLNDSNIDIAFIISCHKSLPKFIKKFTLLKNKNKLENIDTYTYIDESHLINVHGNDNDDNNNIYGQDQDNIEDESMFINIKKLCKCSYVYSFTATPDQDVVKIINEAGHNIKRYLYHMKPIEAISKNMILKPFVKFITTTADKIMPEMLSAIMKDSKITNSEIHHKILVTLQSSTQLKNIKQSLEKMGFKVFSTCSKFGFNSDSVDDEKNDEEIVKFINDVENYNGDCFVLHIRQLIQGIDISSLTDCVLWDNSNANTKHYRHIIQTIGRVLRMGKDKNGKSERLLSEDKRTKKFGGVYFITSLDNENVQKNIGSFICRYYGFDNIEFEIKTGRIQQLSKQTELFSKNEKEEKQTAWNNEIIQTLLINIENRIKEYAAEEKLREKLEYPPICRDALKLLQEYDYISTDWTTCELLDNQDLLNKIYELLEKYNLQYSRALF